MLCGVIMLDVVRDANILAIHCTPCLLACTHRLSPFLPTSPSERKSSRSVIGVTLVSKKKKTACANLETCAKPAAQEMGQGVQERRV